MSRLVEYFKISAYRIIEFFNYTISGIGFYRNYDRFYWKNINNKKNKRTKYRHSFRNKYNKRRNIK